MDSSVFFFLMTGFVLFSNFANFKQFLVAPSKEKGGSISFAGCIQLLGFCAFEACVGLFWPSIMKMRSQYIPEEARSTIMNFFRIPLNIFVCIVLYNVCYNSRLQNALDLGMWGEVDKLTLRWFNLVLC